MQPPKNVHDALRHIDSLLSDVMRTVDEAPLDKSARQLIRINAATADARLLALWVRDRLTNEE
jgi:hypothetical protein